MGERVVLVDDIDGTEGEVTKTYFGVNGSSFELDLNAKNLEKFNKALAPFIAAARPARATQVQVTPIPKRGRPAGSTNRAKTERDYDIADLRAWGAERKIELPQRGRISAATVEQYRADEAWHNKA